jgi:hypothetical protein
VSLTDPLDSGPAAVIGAVTEQRLGVLFSLGVVGFAVTFALQQPLFSLTGWLYILIKRPYQVGDRIAIDGTKGDVMAVDILVTTLWETGGGLVSSNQPSGRTVTFPNSNELSAQVAYETDLAFPANCWWRWPRTTSTGRCGRPSRHIVSNSPGRRWSWR